MNETVLGTDAFFVIMSITNLSNYRKIAKNRNRFFSFVDKCLELNEHVCIIAQHVCYNGLVITLPFHPLSLRKI